MRPQVKSALKESKVRSASDIGLSIFALGPIHCFNHKDLEGDPLEVIGLTYCLIKGLLSQSFRQYVKFLPQICFATSSLDINAA